jgi:Ca-activated chloride channel family protein
VKFEPLVSWWLIGAYGIIALGASAWQIWQVRHGGRKVLIKWLRRAALVVFPAILAIGPSIPGGTSSPGVTNLDVIFAVDTTPSMGAQDYDGTQLRLAGVKSDLLSLASKLPGAHLELITFDSNANVILPFTTDATAFQTAVASISPEVSDYSQGSAIDKPIALITQELNNSKLAHPDRQRLLFYLGDGEQTASTAVATFAPIAPDINGGGVLGYGTTAGGKMFNYTGADATGVALSYVTTVDPTTGKLVPAVSKIDPTALLLIASQLKVTYADRNQSGPIVGLFQASNAAVTIDRSQHLTRYLNLYWLFAIPFAGLFFWEWQNLVTGLLDLRQHHGGKNAKART